MKTSYYRHNQINERPHEILHSRINFNEITFVLKGNLNYEVDGQIISLKENDCICLKSGSLRKRPAVKVCDYVSFNFEGEPLKKLPMHIADCVNGEIKLLIKLCDDIINKYLDWTDKIDSVLELIVKLLYDIVTSTKENPIIIKIKRFIADNLHNKISLSEICRDAGYSPNYCDALFKTHTGISIVNFLIDERIEKAKLLIAENILTLKEVAETVGFDDYNYFSRIFKKRSGYSPRNYKNNVTTNL